MLTNVSKFTRRWVFGLFQMIEMICFRFCYFLLSTQWLFVGQFWKAGYIYTGERWNRDFYLSIVRHLWTRHYRFENSKIKCVSSTFSCYVSQLRDHSGVYNWPANENLIKIFKRTFPLNGKRPSSTQKIERKHHSCEAQCDRTTKHIHLISLPKTKLYSQHSSTNFEIRSFMLKK